MTGQYAQMADYTIQLADYTIQLTGQNAQLAGYNVQLAGYNVQLAGYNVQLTGQNAQLTGYNAQLTGYSIQMAIYGKFGIGDEWLAWIFMKFIPGATPEFLPCAGEYVVIVSFPHFPKLPTASTVFK